MASERASRPRAAKRHELRFAAGGLLLVQATPDSLQPVHDLLAGDGCFLLRDGVAITGFA